MAKACKTVMHRLEVEDGFRVLCTRDSMHTLRLYKTITAELQVPSSEAAALKILPSL